MDSDVRGSYSLNTLTTQVLLDRQEELKQEMLDCTNW